jgi:DnaJ-class molecular chaperone
MKGKIICPACKGNGFRYVIEDDKRVAIDCRACNNQGEISNDEKTKFSLRYLSNYISGLWPKENG